MKLCSKCKIEKPETDFHKCSKNKNGLYANCKACKRKHRKSHRYVDRLWKLKNPDKVHASQLKHHFGMSLEDYKALLKQQKGVCAICEKACRSGNRLAVDHCHKTGQIRGLLCVGCNAGIGSLSECPDIIRKAARYVENFQSKNATD